MLQLRQCSTVSSLIGPSGCIYNIKLWRVRECSRAHVPSFTACSPWQGLALDQLTLFQTKPQTTSELWHKQGSIPSIQFGKAPIFRWVSLVVWMQSIRSHSISDMECEPLLGLCSFWCLAQTLWLPALCGFTSSDTAFWSPTVLGRLTFLNSCACQAVGLSPCLSFILTHGEL